MAVDEAQARARHDKTSVLIDGDRARLDWSVLVHAPQAAEASVNAARRR